jgi:hypothetical protein
MVRSSRGSWTEHERIERKTDGEPPRIALTATFSNCETLTWTDGIVEGSPARVAQIDLALRLSPPEALVTPEGPYVAIANYEADPAAFIALPVG